MLNGIKFTDNSGAEWNIKGLCDYDGLNIYIGRIRLILDKDVSRVNVANALHAYAQTFEHLAADIERGDK